MVVPVIRMELLAVIAVSILAASLSAVIELAAMRLADNVPVVIFPASRLAIFALVIAASAIFAVVMAALPIIADVIIPLSMVVSCDMDFISGDQDAFRERLIWLITSLFQLEG